MPQIDGTNAVKYHNPDLSIRAGWPVAYTEIEGPAFEYLVLLLGKCPDIGLDFQRRLCD
jgi:predicted lipid carrier protein YhbT